ncbi:Chromatin structure remodeling complex protein sfh1 [Didymosphaeria variabile]|uniref:Chromatin structure remodeling complex protein sfh1 n=1 Tax=Didymosphaeria variabile TaxID=1932322 RepID=A0A9W9CB59_9PLEO|nr:Chromatin structure remodeling complex protein sfh1 [Didymosphaeria variabile]KAJ4353379.1 Chromatin structure remodeling complex protein sfh1 [Didymosphaeria variabile]
MFTSTGRTAPPQAFISTYAPRLRSYGNSLISPIVPPSNTLPVPRTTKRGTAVISYAEDGYDDNFEDDSDNPRRATGLRSLRRDESALDKTAQIAALGKEINTPVDVQGIWRDWMGRPKYTRTEKQVQVQAVLPVTLIPIRIDMDIQAFRPDAPLPTPSNAREFGIDETLPAYRQPDMTPAYRLKDTFLWNLHEALMTPDQFAKIFVDEMDLPVDRKPVLIYSIATQIRQQLEEYAGVALHPLFHSTTSPTVQGTTTAAPSQAELTQAVPSRDGTSTPAAIITNGVSTPVINGNAPTNGTATPAAIPNGISASATALPSEDLHNPDDTYRCIVTLNVNLLNRLYSDKFEWSLLHPPGFAEMFAKVTCADIGLAGEWVPAMSHAIYEAVLRLKKETCENGGLVGDGEIDNDAVDPVIGAGWRYDPEHLCDEWEPKVEILSPEEIEKREGDRERQIRRLRRETARFSSTANMTGTPQNDFFANPEQTENMGRGERSKKKRRFRSLSPQGRDTPDVGSGYGGSGGGLNETYVYALLSIIVVLTINSERREWKCSHCLIWGDAVWAVRDGPAGPRTLCANCGYLYERDKKLPPVVPQPLLRRLAEALCSKVPNKVVPASRLVLSFSPSSRGPV